jgi:hypothetical protein
MDVFRPADRDLERALACAGDWDRLPLYIFFDRQVDELRKNGRRKRRRRISNYFHNNMIEREEEMIEDRF